MSSPLFGTGWLLPDWIFPWIGVVAVCGWILGLRRTAVVFGLVWAGHHLMALFLPHLLDRLPWWAWALIAFLAPLLLIHQFIRLLFGESAAGQFTGTWLLRIGDRILAAPFRGLANIIQWLRNL